MATKNQKKFNRRLRHQPDEEALLLRHPTLALKHFNRDEWKIMKELQAAKIRYSPMRIKTMKAKVRRGPQI